MSDPLPQAMILTAIVITLGLTAFLLALAYRSWRAGRARRGAGRHRGPPDHVELAPSGTSGPARIDGRHRRRDAGRTPLRRLVTTRDDLARAAAGGDAAARRGADADADADVPQSSGWSACRRSAPRSAVADRAAGAGRRPTGRWWSPSAAGPRRSGIVLVADQLAALMLVVSAAVTLCVLVYSIGQGMADGGEDTPRVDLPPELPGAHRRRHQRLPRRRPVQPLRRLRDPARRQLRADHRRRHRGPHPRRHHVRGGQPALLGDLPDRRSA